MKRIMRKIKAILEGHLLKENFIFIYVINILISLNFTNLTLAAVLCSRYCVSLLLLA